MHLTTLSDVIRLLSAQNKPIYFTFLFGNDGIIARIGEDAFYRQFVEGWLVEFISRRFENIEFPVSSPHHP